MSAHPIASAQDYHEWAKDEVRRACFSGNNAAIREAAFMSLPELRGRLRIDDKAARILRAECRRWIREQWDFEDAADGNPFGYWRDA